MATHNKYQIVNGTSYKQETPIAVVEVLEQARIKGTHISITYGDITTGRKWNDGVAVGGYVGRGFGNPGLPILLAGKKSLGGKCVMDSSVLEIRETKSGQILYQWKSDPTLMVEEKLQDVQATG